MGLDAVDYRDVPDEGRHDRCMFPFPYENDALVRSSADIITVFACRENNVEKCAQFHLKNQYPGKNKKIPQ